MDEEAAAELEGWLKGSGGKTNNNKVRRVEIDRMAHDVMLDGDRSLGDDIGEIAP